MSLLGQLWLLTTICYVVYAALGIEYVQYKDKIWTRFLIAPVAFLLFPISLLALLINIGLMAQRVCKSAGLMPKQAPN